LCNPAEGSDELSFGSLRQGHSRICKIGSGVRFTFWLEVLTKNLKATD